MGETFYTILDVDRTADSETIQASYRELVKTHHPDVSDADDAARQFKRITEARDVLLDENNRKQYDRVGHNTYIRRYLESNAWSVSDQRDTESQASDGRHSDSDRTAHRSGNATRGNRHDQSGGRSEGRSSSADRSERTTGGRSGTSTGTGTGTRRGDRGSGTDREYQRQTSTDTSSRGTASDSAWTAQSGTDWDYTSSTTKQGRSTSSHQSNDPRDRARTDGWETAHAAANMYTPSGHEPSAATTPTPPITKLQRALKQVGPWLAFHFVFLVSAFLTMLLLWGGQPSLLTVLVSLFMLGGAVFFSVLHMVSRVYS